MQFWKRQEKKPFRIGQLSQVDIDYFEALGLGCGAGRLMNKILPQFTFKFSCIRHDIGYERGGAIKDKLESDWVMFRFITIDTLKIVAHIAIHKWWGAIVAIPMAFMLYVVGMLYIAAVVMFGWFLFEWGKYKTLDELKQVYDRR